MSGQALHATAGALVAPGRGILAIDESTGTIKKRFDSIKVESTEETRRAYRDALITTPGIGEFISGMILFDETIRQSTSGGTRFVEIMQREGVLPGIKVDAGAKALAGHPGEQVTEGLDGLRERLREYAAMGAKFAKWRAVITIGDGIPSSACLAANAHALARYAALCQEAGVVPIVEPEVLMDGTHDIGRCYTVTEATLRCVFSELYAQRVDLDGTVLKASMVLSGSKCPGQAGVEEVAEHTVRCLKASVPAALPGIVFLSGGQSAEVATAHLNTMNAGDALPWALSFSFGRALQEPALTAWAGKSDNTRACQKALHHRSRMNAAACHGRWTPDMEKAAA